MDGDDILRVAIQEPAALDPMRIQDPSSVLIARQLFEGLTKWDQTREEVVPAAARSWRTSDGGRRFVFKLRKRMRFHDGTPVTSDDFAFAFDRIARKRSAADLAYTLEDVKGFNAVNQSGTANHLSGISSPDKRTLVIELSEPYHDFPAVMTHPGLVPLRRAATKNLDRFLLKPVGNGPFRMAARWTAGQEIQLEAFDRFYERPRADGIRFIPFPDAAASWVQFLEGRIDVSEVPSSEIPSARAEYGDDGYMPLLAGYHFGINIKSPNLRDRRMRRAVNLAIDRDAIARSIFKGTMSVSRGIVPEGMPGFRRNACRQLCRHSPSEARRLVKRLPKKRREVRIQFTKGGPHDAVARAVKRDLVAVGIAARVDGYSFNPYLRLLRSGEQDLYRLGWIAEYPAPDVFLTPLFGSGSPDNYSGVASKRVDRILAAAKKEGAEARRLRLYRRAEEVILKSIPLVPIGSFNSFWAAQRHVEGLAFDVLGGFDAVGAQLGAASEEE